MFHVNQINMSHLNAHTSNAHALRELRDSIVNIECVCIYVLNCLQSVYDIIN